MKKTALMIGSYGYFYYPMLQDLEFGKENTTVSSMDINVAVNNYDAVNELGGEEKIRSIVYDDFKNWALGTGKYANDQYWNGQSDGAFDGNYSEANIKKVFDNWFDSPEHPENGFISSLNDNYGKFSYSTNFNFYVDDEVKVFAKDLKEYDGTTLQYIGIMPTKDSLQDFINNINSKRISEIIENLKELRKETFKDRCVTIIDGKIPKFDFEYDLDLKKDLISNGIRNVFEEGNAQLTELSNNKELFISDAKHKANIKFTQDGIKAAAATVLGGAGGGEWYDYYFEVPVEKIDLTFNKPFMFLIRDKETDETWFIGTVYEPSED